MDAREEKLARIIEDGKGSVMAALNSMREEFQKRVDVIVKPKAIDYVIKDGNIRPALNTQVFNLTEYSRNQLLSRSGIPATYADRLLELGEEDLLRDNLRRMTERQMDEGILVRRVDNVIKGWLSPAYKRMDASPVFEAFVQKAMSAGFVPYRGSNTDYRYNLCFIHPKVYQVAKNEFVVYGVSLITSDYGAGALDLCLFVLRIICTNLAMGYDLFRKVHLGSRFQSDQDYIQLSKKTLELDARTIASAVGDVMTKSLLHIQTFDKVIKESSEKEINLKTYLDSFKKKGMRKEVVEKIKTAYEMPMDMEILPQGNTVWRLSNAMSFVAQSAETMDRRIDLEKQAMDILIN